MHKITISTQSENQLVDITDKVSSAVKGVESGICSVFVTHTTAAVMINENSDTSLTDDILASLEQNIPSGRWKHDLVDGNGAAHIKAAIIGPSQTIPVKDGELMLGTWQGIFLAEFDGPRNRNVILTIEKGL